MDKQKIIEGIFSFIVSCIILFILFMVFSVVVFGVPGCKTIKPLPPIVVTEPVYGCVSACDRLATLGCDGFDGSYGPDMKPGTEDDVACVEVCLDLVQDFGLPVTCISEIISCAEVNFCFE